MRGALHEKLVRLALRSVLLVEVHAQADGEAVRWRQGEGPSRLRPLQVVRVSGWAGWGRVRVQVRLRELHQQAPGAGTRRTIIPSMDVGGGVDGKMHMWRTRKGCDASSSGDGDQGCGLETTMSQL